MHKAKQNRLKAEGWQIGSADDFLELTPEESAYVDLKLRLSDSLRKRRAQEKLSQKELAKIVKSSQSRVAKMEAGDPTVSLDLLIKTLLAMGASDSDLADAIAAR
ncbi:MAG: helix-turn-helix transcriptional regulator [Thermoanaerobaculales bacterium]|jgi:DNA-binding XRE family transcriptional regulator|nr:helix-turn-helix transcriptional regulator [Thermoanaerobaculales bacterium]